VSRFERFASGGPSRPIELGVVKFSAEGWRCGDCGDRNRIGESFCWRCGAGSPEAPDWCFPDCAEEHCPHGVPVDFVCLDCGAFPEART
jgi:hypothetical protein